MKKTKTPLRPLILAMLMMIGCCLYSIPAMAASSTEGYYTYTVSSNKAIINSYSGSESNVTIPSKLGGYTVTVIADKAFKGNTTLVSVTIPSTVTTLSSTDNYYGRTVQN